MTEPNALSISALVHDQKTGYQLVGPAVQGLDQYKGPGYVVTYEKDGTGSAVLCAEHRSGNRKAQHNVAASWSKWLSPVVLTQLAVQLENCQKYTGCEIKVSPPPEDAPPPAVALTAGILTAFREDAVLIASGYSANDVYSVLARLPDIPGRRITLGLPCPKGGPLCDIYLNPERDMLSFPVDQRVVTVEEDAIEGFSEEILCLARAISTANVRTIELARQTKSYRPYELVYMLSRGQTQFTEEDEALIRPIIFSCLSEDEVRHLLNSLILRKVQRRKGRNVIKSRKGRHHNIRQAVLAAVAAAIVAFLIAAAGYFLLHRFDFIWQTLCSLVLRQ